MESIDFHSLEIFVAVAEHQNFTGAGEAVGLSQSAVSRRIQDLEAGLGVRLIDRTTRRVKLTSAGEHWLSEANRLLRQREVSVKEFQEIYGGAAASIRLGVGDTIPFAHLPGILADRSQAKLLITAESDEVLEAQLIDFEVDLIVITGRGSLPAEIEILHQYEDSFVLIAPPGVDTLPNQFIGLNRKRELGQKLYQWVKEQAPASELTIEVDNFDLAINLVSLGFGAALVPKRALAVYGKRKPVQRFEIEPVFSRNVIVAGRRGGSRPAHIARFIEAILFSG